MNKKAITPIMTTMLLLSFAIVAFLSFQNWYGTYTTSIISSSSTQLEEGARILGFENQNLILSFDSRNNNKTVSVSIGEINCGDFEIDNFASLNLTHCISQLESEGVYEVIIKSDSNIFSALYVINPVSQVIIGPFECGNSNLAPSVCGIDGNIYDSICQAENSGLNIFNDGEFNLSALDFSGDTCSTSAFPDVNCFPVLQGVCAENGVIFGTECMMASWGGYSRASLPYTCNWEKYCDVYDSDIFACYYPVGGPYNCNPSGWTVCSSDGSEQFDSVCEAFNLGITEDGLDFTNSCNPALQPINDFTDCLAVIVPSICFENGVIAQECPYSTMGFRIATDQNACDWGTFCAENPSDLACSGSGGGSEI